MSYINKSYTYLAMYVLVTLPRWSPKDGHQMAEDNTHNSVWRTRGCYMTENTNPDFHVNYLKGRRALILQYNIYIYKHYSLFNVN
jgi:hypothetical protein